MITLVEININVKKNDIIILKPPETGWFLFCVQEESTICEQKIDIKCVKIEVIIAVIERLLLSY